MTRNPLRRVLLRTRVRWRIMKRTTGLFKERDFLLLKCPSLWDFSCCYWRFISCAFLFSGLVAAPRPIVRITMPYLMILQQLQCSSAERNLMYQLACACPLLHPSNIKVPIQKSRFSRKLCSMFVYYDGGIIQVIITGLGI